MHIPKPKILTRKKIVTYLKSLSNKLVTKPYLCPICHSRVSHFNRFPDYYMDMLYKYQFVYSIFAYETLNIPNNTCPVCGGGDANRLYAIYFRKVFKNVNKVRKYNFVDFAPVEPLSKYLRSLSFLNYRTADLYMNDVDDKVDLTDLKIYKDNSIDIFLCSHVLEHIKNDAKALKELYRILKPGGWGIIMVPILLTLKKTFESRNIKSENDRWKYYGQGDHIRMYSKNGFLAKVLNAGFKIKQLDVKFFGDQTFKTHGISDRSVLYIVSKRS